MPKKTNKPIAIIDEAAECPYDHTSNERTKKTIEDAKAGKGLIKAATVEELFKKLRE